jgi:LytS/YehU family sensor histidine kinase
MKAKKRYGFWKVFWVLLGINVFFFLLGLMLASVTPESMQEVNVKNIFSLSNILKHVFSFCFSLVFYYIMLNVYYRLIEERKPAMSYLRVTVITIIVLTAYYIGQMQVQEIDAKMREKLTTGLLAFGVAFSVLFKLITAFLIPYLTYLYDERKHRKVLEEQKMQLEVEKTQANFNFLKAQINPHFLHNTLNFLYAKSLPYSTELSEGILTLSDIMRYALSEGNARDGKAPLKEEVEHMRNVIKINQLRFSNTLNVQFEVEGVLNGATIIPFVLITLVENAFKHGDLKSPEYPIEIKLTVQDHRLHFICRNKKKTGPKELSTGIGLENIRNRLDLAYGKDYAFRIKDETNFYTTELIIDPL